MTAPVQYYVLNIQCVFCPGAVAGAGIAVTPVPAVALPVTNIFCPGAIQGAGATAA
jgi:hypothetical protein